MNRGADILAQKQGVAAGMARHFIVEYLGTWAPYVSNSMDANRPSSLKFDLSNSLPTLALLHQGCFEQPSSALV